MSFKLLFILPLRIQMSIKTFWWPQHQIDLKMFREFDRIWKAKNRFSFSRILMIFIHHAASFHVAVRILTMKTKPEHGCLTLPPQLFVINQRLLWVFSFQYFSSCHRATSDADICIMYSNMILIWIRINRYSSTASLYPKMNSINV